MMKLFQISILFLFISTAVFSQNTASSFTVSGIKVILKPTVKEVIDVNVYYRGGVSNYSDSLAGIENFALAATTEAGTSKYAGNAFRDRAETYGIDIGGTSGYDYGVISMTCISRFFDQGWELFTAAVTNPVFDPRQVGILKDKIISGLRQAESDPDERIDQLTMENYFAGTPYATNPSGNERTLSSITAEQLKNYYYSTLLNKERMFIVIVGKISKEEITNRIKAAFAKIPAKPYKAATLMPVRNENKLLTEQRQLATNYLTATIGAPAQNSPDYLPFKLAISNLNTRLFREIRTKRNLSYAPYAYTSARLMPFALMYVSTTDPKTSAEVMMEVLSDLANNGFNEDELRSGKNNFITSNYMKEESSSAIASALGNAEIAGDWRIAEEAADRINKVSLQEMNSVLKKYVHQVRWTYLGDTSLVDRNKSSFRTSLY